MTQSPPRSAFRDQPDVGMTGSSVSSPRGERSRYIVWSVVALQACLLIELVIRVARETAAVTEGYGGLTVMYGAVEAVLIAIPAGAWLLGRSWPIVVVDLGWALLSLIRIWPPFTDFGEEFFDPMSLTPLFAALVAVTAAWLVLSEEGRARWVIMAAFLAMIGVLDLVQEGRLVLLGVGLLAFGVSGVRLSGGTSRTR